MSRPPASLRVLQLAGITSPVGGSLRSLSTRKLPQGALAMVQGTLYHLDKNNGETPDDSEIVAALDGGNWLAFSSAAIAPPTAIGQVYAAIADGEGGAIAAWSAPEEIVTYASGVTSLTIDDTALRKRHRFTAATAVTVTVPAAATYAAPAHTVINFTQGGAGQVEVVGAIGVTVNKPATMTRKTAEQFATISLSRVATDQWELIGLLELVP